MVEESECSEMNQRITVLVDMGFSCMHLPTSGAGSTNALCVLVEKRENGSEHEVGRTEVLSSSADHKFVQSMSIPYKFQDEQRYVVRVYSVDHAQSSESTVDLGKQELIGEAAFVLAEIVKKESEHAELTLSKNGHPTDARCSLRAEVTKHSKLNMVVTILSHDLPPAEGPGGETTKVTPFIEIHRMYGTGTVAVFRTPVFKGEGPPRWDQVKLPIAQVCLGNFDTPLLLKVIDFNETGENRLIGQYRMSLKEMQMFALQEGSMKAVLEHPEHWKPSDDEPSLSFQDARIDKVSTFMDYLLAGLEIDFMVAIDCTDSNGHPDDVTSLHHRGDDGSQYEQAIRAVGGVLDHYNTLREYAAYAFGCKLEPGGAVVEECHPLNGKEDQPRVSGLDGIVQAYYGLLASCELASPANIAPSIKKAVELANQPQNVSKFTCLLIITDGHVDDMAETKREIIDATSSAVSMIIVGVGNEDFAPLVELDADMEALTDDQQRSAKRDIVQFVPYNQFKDDPDKLAQTVLAELPDQIVAYYTEKGVTPFNFTGLKTSHQFPLIGAT